MSIHFLGAGTNFLGQDCELRGCVADTRSWASFFQDELKAVTVVSLIDTEANGKDIRATLVSLLNSAHDFDEVNLQLSMHGTKIPCETEDDNEDEAVYPDDGDIITDDWFATVFSAYPRLRINVFADLCFSGGMDREFTPRDTTIWIPMSRSRFVSAPLARLAEYRARLKEQRKHRALATGCVRWFAASREDEPALDVWLPEGNMIGGPHGAFTWAALTTYMAWKPKTARDWQYAIRKNLPSKDYNQHPQLLGAKWARKERIFNG